MQKNQKSQKIQKRKKCERKPEKPTRQKSKKCQVSQKFRDCQSWQNFRGSRKFRDCADWRGWNNDISQKNQKFLSFLEKRRPLVKKKLNFNRKRYTDKLAVECESNSSFLKNDVALIMKLIGWKNRNLNVWKIKNHDEQRVIFWKKTFSSF